MPEQGGLSVANIAAYRFVDIDDPAALREHARRVCAAAGVKGTVLVASEGINLFLAGSEAAVRQALGGLQSDPRLAGLQAKWSYSPVLPFRRLRVKVKPEIVTLRRDGFDRRSAPAPALPPEMLRQWLDEGRDIVLLDTRNAWEVAAGTFEGAIDPGIQRFSEFASRLQEHSALRERTVVTFCTGGIRCEKAAPLMRAAGFRDVWQLEGGILNYFERCGSAHWQGDCVVFDERGALQPDLSPRQPQADQGAA